MPNIFETFVSSLPRKQVSRFLEILKLDQQNGTLSTQEEINSAIASLSDLSSAKTSNVKDTLYGEKSSSYVLDRNMMVLNKKAHTLFDSLDSLINLADSIEQYFANKSIPELKSLISQLENEISKAKNKLLSNSSIEIQNLVSQDKFIPTLVDYQTAKPANVINKTLSSSSLSLNKSQELVYPFSTIEFKVTDTSYDVDFINITPIYNAIDSSNETYWNCNLVSSKPVVNAQCSVLLGFNGANRVNKFSINGLENFGITLYGLKPDNTYINLGDILNGSLVFSPLILKGFKLQFPIGDFKELSRKIVSDQLTKAEAKQLPVNLQKILYVPNSNQYDTIFAAIINIHNCTSSYLEYEKYTSYSFGPFKYLNPKSVAILYDVENSDAGSVIANISFGKKIFPLINKGTSEISEVLFFDGPDKTTLFTSFLVDNTNFALYKNGIELAANKYTLSPDTSSNQVTNVSPYTTITLTSPDTDVETNVYKAIYTPVFLKEHEDSVLCDYVDVAYGYQESYNDIDELADGTVLFKHPDNIGDFFVTLTIKSALDKVRNITPIVNNIRLYVGK